MSTAEKNISLDSIVVLSTPNSTPSLPFTSIQSYLQASSSPEEGAANLVRWLNDGSCLQAPWDSFLRVEGYVTMIFSECLGIATQLPWDHPWHLRLALLIKALGTQPAPPQEVCREFSESYGTREFRWDTFPTFGAQQGETFNYKNRFAQGIRETNMSDCWSPKEWIGINNFLAVLVAEEFGHLVQGFAQSGFYVLANTLEIPRDASALEDNIPSSAVWIITAGKWFREHHGLELDTGREIGETSDFKGPEGLSIERWNFWEAKFKELAERIDLSVEARWWASKAAGFMVGV